MVVGILFILRKEFLSLYFIQPWKVQIIQKMCTFKTIMLHCTEYSIISQLYSVGYAVTLGSGLVCIGLTIREKSTRILFPDLKDYHGWHKRNNLFLKNYHCKKVPLHCGQSY